jgi:DNA-binding beta-propeller fold protein YncE
MCRRIFVLAVAILAIASLLYSQKARVETVGPAEDGSFLLSSGWRIRPAGTNIPLSTLPMSHALAPSGRTLAVMNGGYARASVSLIDLETSREAAHVPIGDGWRGLVFSPSGDKLYAGNGSRGSLTEVSLSRSSLSVEREIDLYPGEKEGTVPHLIAESRCGKRPPAGCRYRAG